MFIFIILSSSSCKINNLYRNKADQLKTVENELKIVKTALSEKEDQLISVQKSLDHERDEKMSLIEEKTKDEEDWMTKKNQWQMEKQELKRQIAEMLEITKNDKNVKLKEAETNEINQAYHKVIKDKESLENENALLKQEVKRLQMIISSPNEFDHIRTSMFGAEEDFGYSSHKNTLEKNYRTKNGSMSNASQSQSEGEFYSLQNSHSISQHHSPPSTFERKLKSFFGFSSSRISEGKRKKYLKTGLLIFMSLLTHSHVI